MAGAIGEGGGAPPFAWRFFILFSTEFFSFYYGLLMVVELPSSALGIGVSMLGVSMEIKRRSGALLCAGCYSRDLAIHDFHGFGLEDIVLI
ncbi:hypothetical protein TSUD_369410 [Trifolium subterraneum]|uniref:Uncharacterized protein n=1 Tax=Trifolium subterraneum TaxID=3900 RepID=A0A2Z6PPZ4_TRISU|nr:hypothetical protein TSUD_369410 [Trifolium subterraneum]